MENTHSKHLGGISIDEEKWVKDFVALLKPQAPPDKTDEELEAFAREMLTEAQERGRAMSEIDVDDERGSRIGDR